MTLRQEAYVMIDSLPDDDSIRFFIDMIRQFNVITKKTEQMPEFQNSLSEKRQAFLHMEEMKKSILSRKIMTMNRSEERQWKKNMVALIDTNVILNYIADREDRFRNSLFFTYCLLHGIHFGFRMKEGG